MEFRRNGNRSLLRYDKALRDDLMLVSTMKSEIDSGNKALYTPIYNDELDGLGITGDSLTAQI